MSCQGDCHRKSCINTQRNSTVIWWTWDNKKWLAIFVVVHCPFLLLSIYYYIFHEQCLLDPSNYIVFGSEDSKAFWKCISFYQILESEQLYSQNIFQDKFPFLTFCRCCSHEIAQMATKCNRAKSPSTAPHQEQLPLCLMYRCHYLPLPSSHDLCSLNTWQ